MSDPSIEAPPVCDAAFADEGSLVEYNATLDVLERNSTSERAARPYLIDGENTHTYREVIERARSFGAGLARQGITAGDRVLMLMADGLPFVSTFWGALRVGVVAVPASTMMSARELELILRDSRARALVFDRSAEGLVGAVNLAGAIPVAVDPSSVARAIPWGQVASDDLPAPRTRPLDVAFWLYTSGTTGRPKAVLHSHGNLRLAGDGQAKQVLHLDAEDRILSASRMYFAYGLGNSVYLPAGVGASVIVNRRQAVPRLVQALIDRYRPTILYAIGSFYSSYVTLPEANPASLRAAISGGEGVPGAALEAFRSRFPGVPLLESFGMSEAMHHITSTKPGEFLPGSVGAALDGYQVRIGARDGDVSGEGSGGEVWVKAPTLFRGYWQGEGPPLQPAVDGWLRTGDWGRLVNGRLYLEGRVDDLMRLSGLWVSPREIEEVICTHPAVREAAVVLIEDEREPTLTAFVHAEPASRDLVAELIRICRSELAAFKVPRAFSLVDELPKTLTGKLQRGRLKVGTRVASPTDAARQER